MKNQFNEKIQDEKLLEELIKLDNSTLFGGPSYSYLRSIIYKYNFRCDKDDDPMLLGFFDSVAYMLDNLFEHKFSKIRYFYKPRTIKQKIYFIYIKLVFKIGFKQFSRYSDLLTNLMSNKDKKEELITDKKLIFEQGKLYKSKNGTCSYILHIDKLEGIMQVQNEKTRAIYLMNPDNGKLVATNLQDEESNKGINISKRIDLIDYWRGPLPRINYKENK